MPMSRPSGESSRAVVCPQGSTLVSWRSSTPLALNSLTAASTSSTSSSGVACGLGTPAGHRGVPNVLCEASRSELEAAGESGEGQIQPLSAAGRLLFRMLAAQYARNDSLSNWKTGLMGRFRLLRVGTRFALGRGRIPPLQDIDQPVTFDRLEKPFGGLTPQAEEMFTRYFRVKIRGLQFCGRAFFGFGLIEGFRSLALVFPSMLWLARLMAAADGRDRLETADVAKAIELADHYHGYTPQFNRFQYRWQIAMLARTGDISRAIAWYSR